MAVGKSRNKDDIIDLKRIRLRDGDILVIRELPGGDEEAKMENRAKIMNKISKNISAAQVLVLFAASLSDVRGLSEKQMNKVGWYRKEDA